jgi:ABC-type Na+ efflux pump permease subunit
VYGGLHTEFPEWANFWGEFASGIAYGILFYGLAHAFWNLSDNTNRVTLGFGMFVGILAVVSLLFLTLFAGLTDNFESGTDFTTLSYIWFSGLLSVFAMFNIFLGQRQRTITGLLKNFPR